MTPPTLTLTVAYPMEIFPSLNVHSSTFTWVMLVSFPTHPRNTLRPEQFGHIAF